MRVTRYMALPQPDEQIMKYAGAITALRDLMVNKTWSAARADVAVETPKEITALIEGFKINEKPGIDPVDAGIASIVQLHGLKNPADLTTPPAAAKAPATTPPATKTAETTDKKSKAPPAESTAATPPPKAAPKSAPAAKPETPAAPKEERQKPLPKEIQTIIDEAAKNMGKALFKDKDDIGAAE